MEEGTAGLTKVNEYNKRIEGERRHKKKDVNIYKKKRRPVSSN